MQATHGGRGALQQRRTRWGCRRIVRTDTEATGVRQLAAGANSHTVARPRRRLLHGSAANGKCTATNEGIVAPDCGGSTASGGGSMGRAASGSATTSDGSTPTAGSSTTAMNVWSTAEDGWSAARARLRAAAAQRSGERQQPTTDGGTTAAEDSATAKEGSIMMRERGGELLEWRAEAIGESMGSASFQRLTKN